MGCSNTTFTEIICLLLFYHHLRQLMEQCWYCSEVWQNHVVLFFRMCFPDIVKVLKTFKLLLSMLNCIYSLDMKSPEYLKVFRVSSSMTIVIKTSIWLQRLCWTSFNFLSTVSLHLTFSRNRLTNKLITQFFHCSTKW